MGEPGAVYDLRPMGVVIEMRRTGEQTGGAYSEFDVSGRPRGFFRQAHVHAWQTERHEVLQGRMKLVVDGRSHVLGPGDAMDVPPNTRHAQVPEGKGQGRVRVRLTPAGREEAFFSRLAAMAAAGDVNRLGIPKPVPAARMALDFAGDLRGAFPPLPVQRALAKAIVALGTRDYDFVDEWDVAAPREAVFDLLADARTYPQWWRPVYLDVDADGEPAVGKESLHHFKGRLPYHLHTRSRIARLERPHVVEGVVDGDLRGRGVWTLTEVPGGTHVRFDWHVAADRPLLRILTPVLQPVLRWNRNWAIARAVDGLEPYARTAAARDAAALAGVGTVR